jgi:site-specific DNA recombinase
MATTRAAIYSRYSSHEQDGSSTIESQIRECRAYARQHGLLVMEDALFVDRAKEATTAEIRDAFKAMIATAQRTPRPFDIILVWKYSRFARSREDSALYKGLLRREGIEIVSASEPVDHHSATGVLIEGMIEVVDQYYSVRLAEEVRRGQTETTLEGFSTGGAAPYGYRRVETPDPKGRVDRTGKPVLRVTLEMEPITAAVVCRIFETYANGAGYKRIVLMLNQEGIPGPRSQSWDVSAIREMLRNPVYRGARVYGRNHKVRTDKGTRSKRARPSTTWATRENAHPAILAPDLWERVQTKLARVADTYAKSGQKMAHLQLLQSRHLLTGLLHCAVCGAHFIARPAHKRKTGKRYHYYGCAFHAQRGNSVCANRTYLPLETIERELLDLLLAEVLTPATTARLLTEVNAQLRAQAAGVRPRLKELKGALVRVEREITNFTRAVGRGDFASLEGALKGAESRRAALVAELAELERKQAPGVLQLTPAALQGHLEGLAEKLRCGLPGRVREAIEQTVGKILVEADGTLTIQARPDGLLGLEGRFASLGCRGRESNPHGVARVGNSSNDYTDRPEVTDAIVWAKQWQGARWSRESGSRSRNTSWRNSGTSGSSPGPTRTRCTILLRVPKGLRQSFGSPRFVLLGHLGVDRRGLDAGVAELLLDDFKVGAAGPVEVRGVGVATHLGGVPRIRADSRHEILDEAPDAVASERPWRDGRRWLRVLAKNLAGEMPFEDVDLGVSPSGSGPWYSARLPRPTLCLSSRPPQLLH